MNVRILGPLEVRDRGGLVDIRGHKPRALLAALSLEAGKAVTTDALIDALWGEAPPRTARAALQNYVAQLRRALGPGVLESRGGGYALELRAEDVDLGLFERLTAEARQLTGERKVQELREALALWRGAPLADIVFEPFAAREAARLEELRTSALEDLIDARLALGEGAGLVPELEGLISEHPFRERLHGQLMLALYRSGRQADALAAYQETRRLLVEELGIEPGAQLRELEGAILRQDAALGAPAEAEPAAAEERRKTVTVLLADIASPETEDPELLHDSSVRALARIHAVLEQHGATIEQRAGDEVLAVFGIPQAHEDEALRTARSALELGVEVDALSDELEEHGRGRIELRVAIESGEALVGVDETGHGFATGPAIGAAKRLLGRAAPGEVVAGPAAVQLLGDAAVLEAPPGEAARVVELREDVPPLARRLERPLVDRHAELTALREAFAEAATSRRCRVVLVLGEAGIGKTRLARELRAELEAAATVLVGRCAAFGKGVTLLPLAEIIRAVRERGPLAELLAGDAHADLIAARLGGLTGDEDAPASGGETFWAVRRLFEACAAERPLVLVLEDLHWAEPTLLDLVDYLGDRAAGPMLFLGLARQELLEERPAWSERDAALLGPLQDDDSEALIESVGRAPESLRAHIVRTAGGNPLFIEQLLAHAEESGEPEALPPSLEALLASRLDRLEAGELAVLQRGAVAGAEFSRAAVVQLLDEEEPTALDRHLVAGVRKGLLRVEGEPDGRFRFHHILIRDAAYATLPKAQRAELHERVARWLESQPGRTDELVGFHLERAHDYVVELGHTNGRAAGLAAEAGARLGAAGLRAWRRADVGATADLLGRAARLLPKGDSGRLELLCEFGLALRTAGEIARAEEVLQEAAEAATADGDVRLELRARLELANVRLSGHPERGADLLLELAEEAIPRFAELGDDRSLGRAWLLSGYVHGGQHCQNAKWTEAAERALAHYRRAGWPTAACVGELATSLYYGPVPVPEAANRCRLLLAEVSDRGGEARVLAWLAGLEAFAGRFDSARSLVERASEIYDDLGYRIELASARGAVLGEIELLAGRPELAQEALRTCCDVLSEMQMGVLLASRASELAEAIYRQGRYDEAAGWLELADEHAGADDVGAQFLRRTVEAKLLARRELYAEAEVVAQEAVALAEPTDAVNNRAKVALDLAEVLQLAGKTTESRDTARRALEGFELKGNLVGAERARRFLGD